MKREDTKSCIIFSVAIALAVLFGGAYLHGCYADLVCDCLHENCHPCRIYSYLESNNPAFAVRQARREARMIAKDTNHDASTEGENK